MPIETISLTADLPFTIIDVNSRSHLFSGGIIWLRIPKKE